MKVKLNTKFACIVTLTVFMVFLMSAVSILGQKRMTSFKQYQYVQTKVSGELGDLIIYLSDMDYRGFQTQVASREWESKVSSLDEEFDYLVHDSVTKLFKGEMKENLEAIESLWGLLKNRLDPVGEVFAQMQSIKINVSEQSDLISKGIRTVYEDYPDNENYANLYDLLIEAHGQIEGIIRSKDTLSKMNYQSSILIAEQLENQERGFTLFTIALAIIVSLFLSVLILIVTTHITKRIKSIQDVTQILAEKDFSVEITPNGSTEMYSLMTNINKMVGEINDFFVVVKTTASKAISSGYTINDSATSTAVATDEINKSIESISEEFNKITEAVSGAINAINIMNGNVKTLVENNAIQTQAISESSDAVNGAATTLEYISTMAAEKTRSAEEMHVFVADGDEKISTTAKILNEIAGQLDEIHDVVSIINNVANQTNLLSMNAAIESAHAGEAGKGFSVVAEEIRKLAEETAKNAKRIKLVVANIVESVTNANKSSTEASSAFAKVSIHADEVIKSLQDISGGIIKIDSQMKQIKDKTSETALAADKINSFCENLAEKQGTVSNEVNVMNDLFIETQAELNQIRKGTGDIVNRIRIVGDASKESYKNMTELENILEEFKTNADSSEEVQQADADNSIETAVSPELIAEMQDSNISGKESVTFDIDSVPEYQG